MPKAHFYKDDDNSESTDDKTGGYRSIVGSGIRACRVALGVF